MMCMCGCVLLKLFYIDIMSHVYSSVLYTSLISFFEILLFLLSLLNNTLFFFVSDPTHLQQSWRAYCTNIKYKIKVCFLHNKELIINNNITNDKEMRKLIN